jgi:hypothetical protein
MARHQIDLGDPSEDRIVVHLDPGGPIELTGLTDSFAALARFYERHFNEDVSEEFKPKLFITRLTSGSVWAEIAPYAVLLGQVYGASGGAVTVADFIHRFSGALRTFVDPTQRGEPSSPVFVARDDAADIRAFLRPLAGRKGAELGLRHVRYQSIHQDGETVVEYTFGEAEINRAVVNIDLALEALPAPMVRQKVYREVMLFLHVASRDPAKEQGRTADKAVIPDISDKPLPAYFRKSVNDLKNKMVRGHDNPLTTAFIVDVHVQYVGDEPKAYIVTEVHSAVSLDDEG